MAQIELLQPAPLLKPDGTLANVGWSRQPVLDCNLEAAQFYAVRFLVTAHDFFETCVLYTT